MRDHSCILWNCASHETALSGEHDDPGFARARRIADAVLYEGYLLYPYRASARKNRYRWTFGVLVPRGSEMIVAGQKVQWEEGRVVMFDRSQIHEVNNTSELPRVVLLFDFRVQ